MARNRTNTFGIPLVAKVFFVIAALLLIRGLPSLLKNDSSDHSKIDAISTITGSSTSTFFGTKPSLNPGDGRVIEVGQFDKDTAIATLETRDGVINLRANCALGLLSGSHRESLQFARTIAFDTQRNLVSSICNIAFPQSEMASRFSTIDNVQPSLQDQKYLEELRLSEGTQRATKSLRLEEEVAEALKWARF